MTRSKNTKKTPRIQHHVRHLLVPHKANNYRPHIVRLHGIVAILSFLVVVQVVYGLITTGHIAILGRVTTVDPTQLLAETNNARTKAGLAALKVSPELSQAAALKAQDMFTNDYWSHSSPAGVSPWKWLSDVGYSYSVAGENLAKNYPNAAATVDAWMDSASHRENVLNQQYQEVGFAVTEGTLGGQDTTLVVAYYGAPSIVAVEGVNDTVPLNIASVTGGVGNIFGYFATAVQSLSPATIIAIIVLGLLAILAAIAHHFRHQLPKNWRKTWKAHHGMFTFVGAIGLAVLLVFATGGGQI